MTAVYRYILPHIFPDCKGIIVYLYQNINTATLSICLSDKKVEVSLRDDQKEKDNRKIVLPFCMFAVRYLSTALCGYRFSSF